jgi:hypothetical protein
VPQTLLNSRSNGCQLAETPPLQFEVVPLPNVGFRPNQSALRTIHILKIAYAILLRVLYNLCYDLRSDRLSQTILVHKFNLFPDRRQGQIEKWVDQLRRQNLFPNASVAELHEMAKDLVMSYLI